MASSDLRDELNCSICLNLYTDPVSLRCGHNFCRSCIVQVLDTQDGSGGYSCPACRAECPEKPPLEKRRKVDDTEEHFLSTQPETKIFCTYCTKSPVPAVKSCLHCEICLCEDHLTAHNKMVDHLVTEPTGSFGNKKCSIHKKVLEYYCPEDAACLCVSCCLVGKHRGHQVDLLEEASEKKKEELRKNLEELKPQKAEIQTSVQNLHDHQKNIQEKASDKRKHISKIFMDIKEQLEMAEKKALSEISRQEKKIVSQISDLIMKLEIKEDELSRKMYHLEEMCHVTDPIRLLQESDITACGQGDGEDIGGDGGKIKSEDGSDAQVSDTKVQDNNTDPKTVLQDSWEAAAHSSKSMMTEEAPDTCHTMDIKAYLQRVNLMHCAPPSLSALRELHRHHVHSVPIESLSIHSGEKIILDIPWMYEKIVVRRRGGFCYENNGLFLWVLQQLGYHPRVLAARVRNQTIRLYGPPFEHIILTVELEGRRWLCDVGYGEGIIEPFPLEAGWEEEHDNGVYRLRVEGYEWYMERKEEEAWRSLFKFTLEEWTFDDFREMCEYHQTSPCSFFFQKSFCSLQLPCARLTYIGCRLISTKYTKGGGSVKTSQELTEEEIPGLLRDKFGIVLSGKLIPKDEDLVIPTIPQ